jgi:hypothetical protein
VIEYRPATNWKKGSNISVVSLFNLVEMWDCGKWAGRLQAAEVWARARVRAQSNTRCPTVPPTPDVAVYQGTVGTSSSVLPTSGNSSMSLHVSEQIDVNATRRSSCHGLIWGKWLSEGDQRLFFVRSKAPGSHHCAATKVKVRQKTWGRLDLHR